MARAGRAGIVERAQEPVACVGAASGIRVIDGPRREVGVHLQEDVGGRQAKTVQLGLELGAGMVGMDELARRPQMRALLEEADVDAGKAKHGDQAQHVVVRQQGKGEIGTGEAQGH